MTAEEALKLKRKGGKLYEPLIFDPRLEVPKEKVVVIHMSATNPHPEDGR
jgi:hypothetical protein